MQYIVKASIHLDNNSYGISWRVFFWPKHENVCSFCSFLWTHCYCKKKFKNASILVLLFSPSLKNTIKMDSKFNPKLTQLEIQKHQNLIHSWKIPLLKSFTRIQINSIFNSNSTAHLICFVDDDRNDSDENYRPFVVGRVWIDGVKLEDG